MLVWPIRCELASQTGQSALFLFFFLKTKKIYLLKKERKI